MTTAVNRAARQPGPYLGRRIAARDWPRLADDLDDHACAIAPSVLTPGESSRVAAELSRSADLSALIRARAEAKGGWLPFSEYMEAALYEPDALVLELTPRQRFHDTEELHRPPRFAWEVHPARSKAD